MRNQTEHTLLIAEVGVCGMIATDVAFATTDNARNDFIADFNGIARRIVLNVLTERDDFTRTFVTERYGNNPKGVPFPFVHVRTADSATLDFNENVVVLKRGNRVLFYFNFFLSGSIATFAVLGIAPQQDVPVRVAFPTSPRIFRTMLST